MARRVRWAGRAKTDLRAAVRHISADSPRHAAVLLRQALDAARSLDEFAERGRVVSDLNDPEVREIFIGSYRLMYEVHPGEVWVMRLLHGSRDFLSAWGRDRRASGEHEDE